MWLIIFEDIKKLSFAPIFSMLVKLDSYLAIYGSLNELLLSKCEAR